MPRDSWKPTPTQSSLAQHFLNQSIAPHRHDKDGIQLPALGPNVVLTAFHIRMLCACQWVSNEIIDTCATFFTQRPPQPLILARSDHYNRLLTTQQHHQQPLLRLLYFGIPVNTITHEHKIMVPIQLPGHWVLVIIQPALQRFVYCDGYGGQPATVVLVISDWLKLLYTTQGINTATRVNPWLIVCSTDAPKQWDGYNCGPNSLLFLYM